MPPTPQEVALVNTIFSIADTQKIGVLTGEQAVKLFAGAKLAPATLGDIWSLADPENNGVLTRKGVSVAVRLIGWAQSGRTISEELIESPGPLPVLEGVPSPAPAPVTQQRPSAITTLPSALPPLSPTDRTKFLNVYNKAGPVNGLVSAENAKNTFIRSRLSNERLNAIWNLVDITNRGSLTAPEFILAMYFIQGSMSVNPTIPVLPPSIPQFLWEQAGGRAPSVQSHSTGGSLPSPSLPGMAGVGQRQFTGVGTAPPSAVSSQFAPLQSQTTGSRLPPALPNRGSNFPLTPQLTGSPFPGAAASPFPLARPQASQIQPLPWDVTAEEKVNSDGFFDGLDTAKVGYVEGGAAVPFMLLSGLPEDILARVWDLADMRNDGRLSKDTFAVAMHLINSVLEGNELPTSISPSLVPPSMRIQAQSTGQPFPGAPFSNASASTFGLAQPTAQYGAFPGQQQQQPQLSEAQRDLLSLDDELVQQPAKPTSPPPRASLSPQATSQPLSQQNTGLNSQTKGGLGVLPQGGYTPQNFSPQPTGFAAGPGAFTPQSSVLSTQGRSATRDLLEDEEAEPRQLKQLSDNQVQAANVRNQLQSTQSAHGNAATERADLETQVSQSAATLSQLQTQLASAKVGYETESKLLEQLRERYSAQAKEIQSTRDELIRAESDLSAVRLEKAEVGGALLREKDDVRELKRQLIEVLEEVKTAKAEVEQVKKDARLQKGLVVIARKQLTTAEGELEELRTNARTAMEERDTATQEVKDVEAGTERARQEMAKMAASPKQNGAHTPSRTFSPAPADAFGTSTPRSTGTPRIGSPAPSLPYGEAPAPVGSPPPLAATPSLFTTATPNTGVSRNPFDRLRGSSVTSSSSAVGSNYSSDVGTPMRSGSPFALPSSEATPTTQGADNKDIGGMAAIGAAMMGDDDDPFGFGDSSAPIVARTETQSPGPVEGTPKQEKSLLRDGSMTSPTRNLVSPTESSFFTPPSSSAGGNLLSDAAANGNVLSGMLEEERKFLKSAEGAEDAEGKFPPLQDFIKPEGDLSREEKSIYPAPGSPEAGRAAEAAKQRIEGQLMGVDDSNVDLDLPPLQEVKEVEESDSDDEDERPLGQVKAEKQAQAQGTQAVLTPGGSMQVPSSQVMPQPKPVSIARSEDLPEAAKGKTSTDFDNAFGFNAITSDEPAKAGPTPTANTSFGQPVANGHPADVSAFSAFDAAFGTLQNNGPPKSEEPFKFDNFDDTFDFGDTSFGHAKTQSNEVNMPTTSTAPVLAQQPSSAAFDDAFGLPNAYSTPAITSPPAPTFIPAPAPAAPLSFDDAFEVSTNEQSIPKTSTSEIAHAPVPVPVQPIAPTPSRETNGTSIRSLSPSAARGSQSSARPPSPGPMSPPRIPAAIPRPPKEDRGVRPGSKYDSDSAGPSKSRLSLHFPFGRSKTTKKKEEKEKKEREKHAKEHPQDQTGGVMPPVPSIPRSIAERDEIPEVGTPGEDGDIPALKHLMEYGFDREQAIAALESTNYNFQRALDKLTG